MRRISSSPAPETEKLRINSKSGGNGGQQSAFGPPSRSRQSKEVQFGFAPA